jgi:hypothetical protein
MIVKFNIKILVVYPIFFLLTICSIQAQITTRSVISSFGNSFSNSSIYLSQTIGQPSGYSALANEETIVNQGFEQAHLFLNEAEKKQFNFTIYPNPNKGSFTVTSDLNRGEIFEILIYDLLGKPIFSEYGEAGTPLHIDISDLLASGAYAVRIVAANGFSFSTRLIII